MTSQEREKLLAHRAIRRYR